MEIHRHPTLTRMWARVGQQPQVPAPGKNEKKVVYGGVDYKTGKLTYTLADSKCGAAFLVFLIALVKAYAGRKIRLVCDNGRFHTTQAVQAWLAEHAHQIEVFWLPPYSPSLNLIERLWGHLKRTILANVLFATIKGQVGREQASQWEDVVTPCSKCPELLSAFHESALLPHTAMPHAAHSTCNACR